MHPDEQIGCWLAMMKGITKDDGLSKEHKESDLDDLEEQIKDKLDDSNLKFEYSRSDGKVTDLRDLDSLPSQNKFIPSSPIEQPWYPVIPCVCTEQHKGGRQGISFSL